MNTMLCFSDVELYYDHVYALKGVSLDLMQGETVALIGANGAGKSSILRAITGLQPIRSGEIRFQGDRIDGARPAAIVRMGIVMVPEGRRVFPYMSVRDNLLMGAFARSDKSGIAQTREMVLARFPRLEERWSQAAGTLSGGEQQMLVIGRALMAKPRLLLLDEPSLGIAPTLVQEIARSNRRDQSRRERLCAPGGAEFAHGAAHLQPRLCAGDRFGGRERRVRGVAGG